MKPLYVVGTRQHVGKTTFCIGLICALRQRGLHVGYAKPLGQHIARGNAGKVYDDALLVSQVLGISAKESTSMIVPLRPGRVASELYNPHTSEMGDKIRMACKKLRKQYDVLVVEGMGHVGAGSCLHLSAAEVSRIIGAKALLLSRGGIGRAIDDVSLCATFLKSGGIELMGVVVNKVWLKKLEKIKRITTLGLENIGIRSFGIVPFDELLASPTFGQVAEELDGVILCGKDKLSNRVGQTIVAAMEAKNMAPHLKNHALIISPGDRTDSIMAVLTAQAAAEGALSVAGIVLSDGLRPDQQVMNLLADSGLPVMSCGEDTYSLAARMGELVFKISPCDKDRLRAAMSPGLINKYVDVDEILNCLQE